MPVCMCDTAPRMRYMLYVFGAIYQVISIVVIELWMGFLINR